ncbi:hypothetical protein [Bradyrhizobium sp. USDA 3650]
MQELASERPAKEMVLSLTVCRHLNFIVRLPGLHGDAIIVDASRLNILGRNFNDRSIGRQWMLAGELPLPCGRGKTYSGIATSFEVTISMESHYPGWTPTDDARFRHMVENGASEDDIALALRRTPQQLRRRGYDLGLPLKWFKQFRAIGLSERVALRR